jgi:hypothetical protein
VNSFAADWGAQFPEDRKSALGAALLSTIGSNDREFFLARFDGIPVVTTSFYRSSVQSANLTGGNVLSMFRNRGIYRALLRARFERLRCLDVQLATAHMRADTSAPILGRPGFATAAGFSHLNSNSLPLLVINMRSMRTCRFISSRERDSEVLFGRLVLGNARMVLHFSLSLRTGSDGPVSRLSG